MSTPMRQVAGMKHWDNAMQKQPTYMSVLFSSIAAVFGSPGQANYSAANAALDGLASLWQSQGQGAVALSWGAWSGGGMASQDPQSVARMERMGLGMISVAEGLAALGGVLGGWQVNPGSPRLPVFTRWIRGTD